MIDFKVKEDGDYKMLIVQIPFAEMSSGLLISLEADELATRLIECACDLLDDEDNSSHKLTKLIKEIK